MCQRTISFMIKFWACSVTAAALLFVSCTKTSDIGHIVRPAEDSLRVVTDSFIVKSSTIKADHLYSETTKPVLGHYTDNIYGEFRTDFLTEFRYIKDLKIDASAKSDSLYVVMYYRSFFGDSTAVQEATVYEIDKRKLDFSTHYYSDTDLSEFCSKSVVLGKHSYVAYDNAITPQDREKAFYCNTVRVKMPDDMLSQMLTRKDIYQSQEAFTDFLKGVYITNTFGQQTVLLVDSVNLELSYHYAPVESKPDSIVYRTVIFPSNRETSLFIRVEGDPMALVEKPDSVEYVSCPGGTFVQIVIPFERMYKRMMEDRNLGTDSLNLNYLGIVFEPAIYTDPVCKSARMSYPPYTILIRKDDMESFFTQSLYPAPGIDTELGFLGLEEGDSIYTFVNGGVEFEKILRKASKMNEAERKVYFESLNPYCIVPVTGANDIQGTNAVIRHQFHPYGVRVRSGVNEKSPMRLVVAYTTL